MKVERNGLVAGQKIKTVRGMMRDVSERNCFTVEDVAAYLHKQLWSDHVDDLVRRGVIKAYESRNYKAQEHFINSLRRASITKRIPDQTANAQALIDQLLADGMVERREDRDGSKYKTTIKGNALAMVGLLPRMNRAKAEKLLSDALERVATINARADLLHWVTEVRVFGSYLRDTDDLGDLDLAISLERRPVEGGDDAWIEACLEMAEQSGNKFGSFLDMLGYADALVRRTIKNRSPYISLHGIDELDRNPHLFAGKTIYTFVPARVARNAERSSDA